MNSYIPDFVLYEATGQVTKLMLTFTLVAFIVALLTLPIFLIKLAFLRSWFWAAEARREGKIRAHIIYVLFPIFSLAATIISLGYFGGFDIFQKRPYGTKGSIQRTIEAKYNDKTRGVLEKMVPRFPDQYQIDWSTTPDLARGLIAQEDLAPPSKKLDYETGPFGETEEAKKVREENLVVYNQRVAAFNERVAGVIAQSLKGPLTESPSAINKEPLDREEQKRIRQIVQDAVQASFQKQQQFIGMIRGILMLLLLLAGPIPLGAIIVAVFARKSMNLILRSLTRSFLRTCLTYLAIFVLVWILLGVWSVLDFLSALTVEKDSNLKALVTEKYQIPSQMKPSTLDNVKKLIAELPPDLQPENIEDNIMTWAFVGGTLDPKKMSPQNSLFFFATEPSKVLKMFPGIEDLSEEYRKRLEIAAIEMEKNPRAVVIGQGKLAQLGKRVGDRIKVTSLNYKGIEFDFEIIEEFPSGTRWEQSAVMNRRYLDNALDSYQGTNGSYHPLHDKCMNLIWIRLPNKQAFETLSAQVNNPANFSQPVKMEIESSAYASFLSPFKTLVFFMRWALAPGLLVIMTLIISLVVSIGVRERRTELAVLKVLGFRPWMVMMLVFGESLLIGLMSSFIATALAFAIINARGGIPLPIAFFGKFFIPENALWWGPAVGLGAAVIGTILPAINVYYIKVTNVFSRIA
ncbi:MAG: ABC transporter permease [Zavarzinella sp.]